MPRLRLRKIFCVIDPTTNTQRALLRAANMALQVTGAVVHAYLCFSLPGSLPTERREAFREAEHSRHRAWLAEIVALQQANGLKITTEIECQDDWRRALVGAATRSGADLVVRASTPRSALHRRVLKTTDWMLLRHSSSPVLFVKSKEHDRVDKVLAAVDMRAKDEPHQRLTDHVLEFAQGLALLTGAELHAVSAYSGSTNVVQPPELAKRAGVAPGQAHVGEASPDALISTVAQELDNPLVILGSIPRTGMTGAVVGNTAERILDHIQSDVICIVQRPQ